MAIHSKSKIHCVKSKIQHVTHSGENWHTRNLERILICHPVPQEFSLTY